MALVTSILIFNWLSRLDKPAKQNAPPVQAAMVAVSIKAEPMGTELTQEMLKLVPYPKESLPHGHFAAIERLKGRVLISNVAANEPILESKLAPLSVTTGGVAAVTDPQKRAMAVKVDDVVGVAGFINPGNHVDVLVALRRNPPITKIMLQNILVLATGAQLEKSGKAQQPRPVKVITLEVTPQEAEKLALASTLGRIRLALRNHLASEPVLTKGETIASVLDSYSLKESKNDVINLKKPSQAKLEMVYGSQVVRYEIVDGQVKKTRLSTPSINAKRHVPRLHNLSSQNTPTVAPSPPKRQVKKPPFDKPVVSKAFPYKPMRLLKRVPLEAPPTLPPVDSRHASALHTWLRDLPPRYGPVQNGDTLYSIVTDLDVPKDVIWQAIVHLWKTNPQHFDGGHLYGLRPGAYLTISRQVAKDVDMLSNNEALQMVSEREARRFIPRGDDLQIGAVAGEL